MGFIVLMKTISLRLKIQNGLHRIYEEHFSSLKHSNWASSKL
ncbi:hypothetical protein J2S19_001068 [Metabacillus malikii]|uniref:Uncharacterized protein n=1 Tax=Metabacillus malikii TaxID=1504265 RepID=A0ABT9ZC42_9BACI|nr:hypothetical protein [Metabacillus malikii]